MGCVTTLFHNRTISRFSRQKCFQLCCNHVLKWASVERQQFLIMHLGWSKGNGTQQTHNPPIGSHFEADIADTISRPPPTIEHARSINNHCGGSVHYTAMRCIAVFLNWVLHGQSFQYVCIYNFTNMHAMSHRSDFFACSSRVNIQQQQSTVL